ncbi:unnamed protein product [Trichobilharzia regenti]|nr:unnamed protein product [Trichobilharzia regenti]
MVEPALQQFTNEQSQSVRQKISHILMTQRNIPSNLTKQEYEALRNLKKDKSIDKGNIPGIMNRTDYEKKAIEYLSEGPYLLIEEKKKSAEFKKLKLNTNRPLQEMKPKTGNSL